MQNHKKTPLGGFCDLSKNGHFYRACYPSLRSCCVRPPRSLRDGKVVPRLTSSVNKPWHTTAKNERKVVQMRRCKIPNRLILDEKISLSARRLGAVLCAVSNRLGRTQKSLAMLAGLSGLSVATVRSSITELERAGYLSHAKTYRYDFERGHLIYNRNIYFVNKHLPGGYTLVPASLFRARDLSSAAFVVALYVYQQGAAAAQGRAYPAISRIAMSIGIAKSTVCRALIQLKDAAMLLVQHCRKRDGAFAANSYFCLCAVQRSYALSPVNKPVTLSAAVLKFYHRICRPIKEFLGLRVVPNLANL